MIKYIEFHESIIIILYVENIFKIFFQKSYLFSMISKNYLIYLKDLIKSKSSLLSLIFESFLI